MRSGPCASRWRRTASITSTPARWLRSIRERVSGWRRVWRASVRILRFEGELGDEAPPEWRGQVDQTFFRGRPYENEVVFCHRASRTLIICDLAFNFGPATATPTRLLMQLLRSYGRFGPSTLDPLLIRDRMAARQSLERILGWDFDRVIVAHGDVLERGGREGLRSGYHWLLRR